jgi:hypothetical protein
VLTLNPLRILSPHPSHALLSVEAACSSGVTHATQTGATARRMSARRFPSITKTRHMTRSRTMYATARLASNDLAHLVQYPACLNTAPSPSRYG